MSHDFFLKSRGVGDVKPLTQFRAFLGSRFHQEELLHQDRGLTTRFFGFPVFITPWANGLFNNLVHQLAPFVVEQLGVPGGLDNSAHGSEDVVCLLCG